MGQLVLPESGILYLDTSVLIYSVEKHEAYAEMLEPMWSAVKEGQIDVVTSSLMLLEALIVPLRNGDDELVEDYRTVLEQTEVVMIPITTEVLFEAARLRSRLNLKTPDAIHAATAISANCDLLLTNDVSFRRLPGLNTVILDDAVLP